MPADGALALVRREYDATDEAGCQLGNLASGPRYRGGVDSFRDGVLSGWAIDLAHPGRALPVALEAAGVTVADDVADQPRGDLAEILPGNRAGFSIDFKAMPAEALAAIEATLEEARPAAPLSPEILTLRLDGYSRLDLGHYGITARKALAQVRLARRQRAPAATPERFERTPFASSDLGDVARGPRYRGGLDGLIGTGLRGWAVDLKEPRTPAALAILAEGREVFTVATDHNRPDIGRYLPDNVAGFFIDLTALPPEAAAALCLALAPLDPASPAPAERVALRIGAEGALIDIGAFGVAAGDLAAQLAAPRRELSPAAAPDPQESPRKPRRGKASALHWLTDHLTRDLAPSVETRPARRFAAYLASEIERSTTVSATVKRHAAEIAPLFDPFHYLEQLDEPEEAIANPLLHYTLVGWRLGMRPTALFDPEHYGRRRGAVTGDPLRDFLREGAAVDADPHPLFELAYYRKRHLGGDASVNPLEHYLEIGGRLRLDPSPLFDSRRFLETFGLGDEIEAPLEAFEANPTYHDFALLPGFDAALYRYQVEIERGERIQGPPILHYLGRGFEDETLLPNLLFDPAFYRERNKLEFPGPALAHYFREGRDLDCHPFFSPVVYDRHRGEAGADLPALEHALQNPGAFISDARMDGPIDPRLFAFARQVIEGDRSEAEFDAEIYRNFNPDLKGLEDEELADHFRNHGEAEGRLCSRSPSVAMRLSKARICDLPLGFVFDDYVSIYPDLAVYKDQFGLALFHYMRSGREERRLIGKWRFRITDIEIDLPTRAAPLQVAPGRERIEVGILIHAFYPELLPELIAFAQNFRNVSFDIFINIVDIAWTPDIQEQVRAICPGAFVMLSNDSGRDVGGFTRLLAQVDISRYDLFAFMHSKKSPHIAPERGEYWRKALLRAFAGSPDVAAECVRMFRENPGLGMIGAAEWRSQDMGKNIEQYERLLDLLDVRGQNRELDYVSGFMFLVRSDVVARLYETLKKLDFEYGGDKDLDFHIDGQIAHGVERAAPALVRQMGYEVAYR